MSGTPSIISRTPEDEAATTRDLTLRRIELTYSLTHYYTALPFSVFSVAVVLLLGSGQGIRPFIPLVLQIASAFGVAHMGKLYRQDLQKNNQYQWERRYILISALSGACWGVGIPFWVLPGSFGAVAALSLAYLGMSAAEFAVRFSNRPAYLAHAAFSLVPLILYLLSCDDVGHVVTAGILVYFAATMAYFGHSFSMMVLGDMLVAPKPAPAEEPAARDILDRSALQKLERSVGRETLVEILQSYLENAVTIGEDLQTASEQRNWVQATRLAKDIVGSAGGLGLTGVAASAHAFDVAVREHADDDALFRKARRIVQDGTHTRLSLVALYPELDDR